MTDREKTAAIARAMGIEFDPPSFGNNFTEIPFVRDVRESSGSRTFNPLTDGRDSQAVQEHFGISLHREGGIEGEEDGWKAILYGDGLIDPVCHAQCLRRAIFECAAKCVENGKG